MVQFTTYNLVGGNYMSNYQLECSESAVREHILLIKNKKSNNFIIGKVISLFDLT